MSMKCKRRTRNKRSGVKCKRSMKGKRSSMKCKRSYKKIRKTYKKNKIQKRKYRGGNISWYGSGALNSSLVSSTVPKFNNDIIQNPMPSNKQFSNKRGGGFLTSLMPQDLVNVGRSLTGGIERGMNSFQGVSPSDSTYSLPTNQPSIIRDIQRQPYLNTTTMDINKIYTNAGNNVANL